MGAVGEAGPQGAVARDARCPQPQASGALATSRGRFLLPQGGEGEGSASPEEAPLLVGNEGCPEGRAGRLTPPCRGQSQASSQVPQSQQRQGCARTSRPFEEEKGARTVTSWLGDSHEGGSEHRRGRYTHATYQV